jgi:hypothetical protein
VVRAWMPGAPILRAHLLGSPRLLPVNPAIARRPRVMKSVKIWR